MKRFLSQLAALVGIHVLGLFVLALLRLILFIAGHHMLGEDAEGDIGLQSLAFLHGLWFDNVIACYILIVPLAVILLTSLAGVRSRLPLVLSVRWMQVFWGVAFAVSAANIPYFLYFFKNINSSIWNWAEYGLTTLGMLFGEPSYYPPMLAFVVLLAAFVWLGNKWVSRFVLPEPAKSWMGRIPVLLLGACCVGLCLFGIRGRRGYNPIKVSAAYYCQDAFLNQLGVNPAFNLLTSTLDDFRPENVRLGLMNEAEALKNVQKLLQRQEGEDAPLQYELLPADSALGKRNVVLIFMESMSADLMQTFGQEKPLTPFLDSLFRQSTGYTRCYSAGIHTNHGLYATLYSYPALMYRNLMKGSHIPTYSGLPTALREAGYRNLFFMTHESQYDNMNAFLRTNGYDEIYSQENYPKEKVVNSFGVQDDYLYRYALDVLDRFDGTDTPFFATLLSISNHPPYVIPENFQTRTSGDETRIVEYADWALRMFFDEARKKAWYDNTVFVLLGDHGKLVGEAESVNPESYNHVPLMFFVPGAEPKVCDDWALQMDIQPTLLSMLGIRAPQHNFGVNLQSVHRPFAFYTADNVICVRDERRFYVYEPSTGQEHIYLDGKPADSTHVNVSDMRAYLFSMIQCAESLLYQGKTTVK